MKLFAVQLLSVLATSALALDQKPLTSPKDPLLEQPPIGFGTWNLAISPENTTEAVSLAIQAGYRQIDGAAIYRNEVAVGKGIAKGIKKAGISREDLWVTSKLWNDQYAQIPRPFNLHENCDTNENVATVMAKRQKRLSTKLSQISV